jgi:hypothetical protein
MFAHLLKFGDKKIIEYKEQISYSYNPSNNLYIHNNLFKC